MFDENACYVTYVNGIFFLAESRSLKFYDIVFMEQVDKLS